ncbi:MAG TPA: universal stress protein [Pseudacidobacterium sp.]|nr:universal stress protein [Pseudacidobacterium sp.]
MPVIGDVPGINLNAVIYATDFSLGSQNAGFYARLLARYFSSKLIVAHAFTLSQTAMEVEADPKVVSQQRKDLQSLLTEKATLLGDHSLDIIPALVDGNPKDVIPQLADENAPSLIVLGTHGGGRIERNLIGSVAEQVLRSTRWPSFTVGPQVQLTSDKSFSCHRILYATDFTPAATHAAVYAVSFAGALGAEIDVLNVIQEEDIKHPERLSELKTHFYNALDKLVPQQAREFCDPRTFIAVGKAHDEVLRHIQKRSIDLLVLGIRKTSHLSLEMRTSGAFQLIVDAPCPVLTIRG